MNKAELEREYKTENGVIVSPGKFQGEALYVPYFWHRAVADDFIYAPDDTEYRVYYRGTEGFAEFGEVSEVHAFAEFAELAEAYAVVLTEDEQGFVYSVLFMTEAAFEQFRAVVEGSNSAEGGQ